MNRIYRKPCTTSPFQSERCPFHSRTAEYLRSATQTVTLAWIVFVLIMSIVFHSLAVPDVEL